MAKFFALACVFLFVCGTVFAQESDDPVTDPSEVTTVPDTTVPPAPETTTTPAPETTTPAPETTTPPPETTTPAPETTTPPAPPTPAPEVDYNYNITENNVTCIMIEGSVSFMVNYSIGGNETRMAKIALPKHPKTDFRISGTCNGSNGEQKIEIAFGEGEKSSSVELEFSHKGETWSVSSFTASLYMDPEVFVNGTEAGKTIDLDVEFGFTENFPMNHSLLCHSTLTTSNVTGTVGSKPYSLPLSSKLEGIHIQAFNQIANEPDFVSAVHCAADQTSDVVPIAVGCALAALVVIVLIAYLVGRRRRSAAYQSV